MTNDFTKANDDQVKGSNLKKDPKDWKTGSEAPTDAQLSYLQTLAEEAGEQIDPSVLTKAKAAEEIERLQQKTGRGKNIGK